MSFELSRKRYADLYGPTVDDAVRLGDTDLFAQIDRNMTAYVSALLQLEPRTGRTHHRASTFMPSSGVWPMLK